MAKVKESSLGKSARSMFPAPDHDHRRCSSDAMAIAEAQCLEHGRRLTPIRRQVLSVLLTSHQPLGAYEIMERLAPGSPRPAAIPGFCAPAFFCENAFV